jgi:HptB-dependent secretion and biofilm anti anti-sigma factor
MKFTSQIEDQTGMVKLEGRFTFETHPAFKSCTQTLLNAEQVRRVVLDMEGVSYMDASSLGMILLLRENTESRHLELALRRPSAAVRRLLEIVQFEKIFEIMP